MKWHGDHTSSRFIWHWSNFDINVTLAQRHSVYTWHNFKIICLSLNYIRCSFGILQQWKNLYILKRKKPIVSWFWKCKFILRFYYKNFENIKFHDSIDGSNFSPHMLYQINFQNFGSLFHLQISRILFLIKSGTFKILTRQQIFRL